MPGLVVSSLVVDGHTQLGPVQVLCQRLPRLKSVVPGVRAADWGATCRRVWAGLLGRHWGVGS